MHANMHTASSSTENETGEAVGSTAIGAERHPTLRIKKLTLSTPIK